MEHNVLCGFLVAREEAVEMLPGFLDEISGIEIGDEFRQLVQVTGCRCPTTFTSSTSSPPQPPLVQRLHDDVRKAHAALDALQV